MLLTTGIYKQNVCTVTPFESFCLLPFHRFQMFSQLLRSTKLLSDERPFEPAADDLNLRRLTGITLGAAGDIIKEPDRVTDVVENVLGSSSAPVVEVNEL